MEAPATRKVVEALSADGADVRFVGGCVRDALLGRESSDIDLGTPDRPERVMALLDRAGIESHTVPRGIEHGTVTALAGGTRFEITTLRHDVRTDGRHAEVAFTGDWQEDAARRDFSFNAMSMTPDGTLHDYFGGQADLKAGRVRFVGDPAQRIAEDHLRLLRFFRFFAWYGQGEADPAALDACRAAVHTIQTISGERVQGEMLKLLAAPNPLPAVSAMRDTGVLYELLPEAQGTDRLERLVKIEQDISEADWAIRLRSQIADADWLRRLAALIASVHHEKAANLTKSYKVAARWRLHSIDGARLTSLVAPPEAMTPDLEHYLQRHLFYELGSNHYRNWVLLAWAERGGNEADWRTMLATAGMDEAPEFPVRGADVLERGISPGLEVGILLDEVKKWWIEQGFTPDRAATLDRLDALVADRRGE